MFEVMLNARDFECIRVVNAGNLARIFSFVGERGVLLRSSPKVDGLGDIPQAVMWQKAREMCHN